MLQWGIPMIYTELLLGLGATDIPRANSLLALGQQPLGPRGRRPGWRRAAGSADRRRWWTSRVQECGGVAEDCTNAASSTIKSCTTTVPGNNQVCVDVSLAFNYSALKRATPEVTALRGREPVLAQSRSQGNSKMMLARFFIFSAIASCRRTRRHPPRRQSDPFTAAQRKYWAFQPVHRASPHPR